MKTVIMVLLLGFVSVAEGRTLIIDGEPIDTKTVRVTTWYCDDINKEGNSIEVGYVLNNNRVGYVLHRNKNTGVKADIFREEDYIKWAWELSNKENVYKKTLSMNRNPENNSFMHAGGYSQWSKHSEPEKPFDVQVKCIDISKVLRDFRLEEKTLPKAVPNVASILASPRFQALSPERQRTMLLAMKKDGMSMETGEMPTGEIPTDVDIPGLLGIGVASAIGLALACWMWKRMEKKPVVENVSVYFRIIVKVGLLLLIGFLVLYAIDAFNDVTSENRKLHDMAMDQAFLSLVGLSVSVGIYALMHKKII